MIVVSGLFAAFCILWILCTQMVTAYFSTAPVATFTPIAEYEHSDTLQFPFQIPGTTLIAEQIVSYDGLFSEGEDRYNVTNVAALMLYNCGESGILETRIQLQAGEVEFLFFADTIPAGARILVPEHNAMEFGPKEFTSCTGTQQVKEGDWLLSDRIKLEFTDMGEVRVTNLTQNCLSGICLYYKNYYPETEFYVGGSTQKHYIALLEPGEYIQIYPRNYAYKYSMFARISTE